MAATKQDYYALLGVSRTANEKEIRQAYRRLARKYHPDVNPGDKAAEARFKEIGEAYEVLSDPEKRKKYDQFGPNWQQFERGGPPPGASRGDFRWASGQDGGRFEGFGDVDEATLNDLLGGLFGGAGAAGQGFGGRRQRRTFAHPGQDYEQPVEVTLEEAFAGTQRLVQLQAPDGSTRRLEVKVPAGVTDGSRIRMAGEGGPGLGGAPNGDLYLVVSVRPHPTFSRKGDDLYVDVPVPFHVLVLGGEALVPTLKGTRLELRIPPETQNGRVFRLGGQGMPRLDGAGRGDLFATATAVLPTNLTDRERELVRELARERGP
jgi:DnaJ-class molecular chaperone